MQAMKRARLLNSSSPSTEMSQETAERSGDLVLEFASGEQTKVFSQVLLMTSPVFHDMLAACNGTGTLKVEGSKAAWDLLLLHLYPSYPRPELSMSSAYLMLPVVHQYNVITVLAEIDTYLSQQFPEQLSADPKCPRYIFKWLQLADNLQLDELRKVCMRKVRDMAIDKDKQLEQALLADVPEAQPTKPKPTSCPLSVSYNSSANCSGSGCIAWCNSCQYWTCSKRTNPLGCCPSCRQVLWKQPKTLWLPTDQPQLLDSIKSLSRSAVDDLLASLVAVCSGDCRKSDDA